jgi:hypothetical protein
MGILDGFFNRIFKTAVAAEAADGEDETVLELPAAAIRYVGATVTRVAASNRIDIEFPTLSEAFDNQAATVNIATTGAAGSTNIGKRAGESVSIGNATGALDLTASGDTFFAFDALEITCSSSFAVIATDECSFSAGTDCTFVVTGLFGVVADVFAASAQSGVIISSAVTPPVAATGVVNIKADVSVLIDAIRADYERVAKGNGTTLEAGKLNDLTGSAWTLPAISGVADGERVIVAHSLAAGTISAAGADVINAGNGHATDTTFALSNLQSVVVFQRVNTQWRVHTSANAPSGGGASVTDGTGTLGFLGAAGALSATGLTSTVVTASGTASLLGGTSGGGAGLTVAGDAQTAEVTSQDLFLLGAPRVGWSGTGAGGEIPGVAGIPGWLWVLDSGAAQHDIWEPTSGAHAFVGVYDAAASSETYDGTLVVVCTTKHTTTCTGGEVEVNAATWDVNMTGPATIDCAALTVTPTSTTQIRTASGDFTAGSLDGKVTVYAGGGGNRIDLFTQARRVDMCATATGEAVVQFHHPTPVVPPSSAAQSLGGFTLRANTSGTYDGVLDIRNGSGNHEAYDVRYEFNCDGSNVTVHGLTVTDRGATQGTIGTVTGDLSVPTSGLSVTPSIANASGFTCEIAGHFTING